MTQRQAQRTAIITGGNSGIGRAIAAAFARNDTQVAISGRDQGRLQTTAHDLGPPGGRIINISSIAAFTGGSRAGSTAYAAAKAGVHGLTYGLARELSHKGITVNAIAPGFIAKTGFTGEWSEERVQGIIAETPVG